MRIRKQFVLILLLSAGSLSAQRTTVYSYSVPAPGPSVGYSPNGNLLSYSDLVNGSWSMQYDNLNRLQTANDSGSYQALQLDMTYDSFGNRLTQTPSGAHPVGFIPTYWAKYDNDTVSPQNNGTNRLTSSNFAPGGLAYDDAGNIQNDGLNQMEYDAEGRLCAVYSTNGIGSVTQYLYDAEGRRVAKGHSASNTSLVACSLGGSDFVATERYVIGQSGEQVSQLDGAGNWQHTNVYASGKMIATYDSQSPGLHFHIDDPLGSRRVQLSSTGTVELTCSNLPFGDSQNCNGPGADATEHHFTGKERDTESGLDHFQFRSYASTMGRWTSPDPSGLFFADPENPQSLNLYSYVINAPTVLSDPNGLWFNCDASQTRPTATNAVGNVIGAIDSATNSIASFFCHLEGHDGDAPVWLTNPPTSGHYIAVAGYTKKVMLQGHMGDALDSNDTNGWATRKDFTLLDRALVAVGKPFAGQERRDQETYVGVHPKYLYHSLTNEQFATIQERIRQRYDPEYGDQHVYELFLNSCGQNVSDDLRAAHVHGAPPRWLFIPNLDYLWLRLQAH